MAACGLVIDRAPVCCGFEAERIPAGAASAARWIATGAESRTVLQGEPAEVPAFVSADTPDVAPINLAAALKRDEPDRAVYLECDEVSGSLASRMDAAGIDGPATLAALQEVLEELAISEALKASGVLSEEGIWTSPRVTSPASVCERSGDAHLVWSLVSGRGGVGKSTLAVLFALCAWEQGKRTALVDADVQFGDLRYLCGGDGRFEPFGMDESGVVDLAALEECPSGSIALICPLAGPEHAPEMERGCAAALDAIGRVFDIAIVNTGSNWTDAHGDIVERSDAVIFLMDQRPTSVRGCREAADLCRRMGTPTSKFVYMLNRCSGKGGISGYDCALSLDASEVIEIREGGNEVEEAMSMGIPSSLLVSGSPLVASVGEAFSRLSERFGLQVPRSVQKRRKGPVFRFGFGAGRRREDGDEPSRKG